jgi:hypothetical protein
MKESYKVRPSQSPWPRVMRCVGNWRDEAFTEVQPGGVLSSESTLVWWPTLS